MKEPSYRGLGVTLTLQELENLPEKFGFTVEQVVIQEEPGGATGLYYLSNPMNEMKMVMIQQAVNDIRPAGFIVEVVFIQP